MVIAKRESSQGLEAIDNEGMAYYRCAVSFMRRHLLSLGLFVLALMALALSSEACANFAAFDCGGSHHQTEHSHDRSSDHGPTDHDCCESHIHTPVALASVQLHSTLAFSSESLRVTDDLCPESLSADIEYPPQLS